MKNLQRHLLLASLATYQAEGENALSNLYGAGQEDFDGPANGVQYVNADALRAQGIGSINSAVSTIGITLRNNSLIVQQAVLFGGYANSLANNYGSPALDAQEKGVFVTCDTVPYAQLLEETKSSPKRYQGLRLVASGTAYAQQLTNQIFMNHQDSTGMKNTMPFNPNNFFSPYQQQDNILDAPDFDFIAAGDSSLSFALEPGTSIKFILTLRAQSDMGRVLNGKSSLEVNTAPQAAGMERANFTGRRY